MHIIWVGQIYQCFCIYKVQATYMLKQTPGLFHNIGKIPKFRCQQDLCHLVDLRHLVTIWRQLCTVCPENHTLCNAGFSYIVVKNSNNGKESYLCTKIFLFSSRTFSKMVAHLVTQAVEQQVKLNKSTLVAMWLQPIRSSVTENFYKIVQNVEKESKFTFLGTKMCIFIILLRIMLQK